MLLSVTQCRDNAECCSPQPAGGGPGQEEEEAAWAGLLGPATWRLLCPARRHWLTVGVAAVLGAAISLLASVLLRLPVIATLFPGPGLAGAVLGLGWAAVVASLQPLYSHAPPETAAWRHAQPGDSAALVRPATLLVCQLAAWAGVTLWNVFYVANIFYAVQAALPLAWLLGLLPPPDTLLLWLAEQLLVSVLGGSAAATTPRLLLQLFAAVVQAGVVVGAGLGAEGVLLAGAGAGYLLSTDWTSALLGLCCGRGGTEAASPPPGPAPSPGPGRGRKPGLVAGSVSRVTLLAQRALAHLALLGLCLVLAATSAGDPAPLGWAVVAWAGLVTVGLLQVVLVAGAADLGDTTDTRQTCRRCLTMLLDKGKPFTKI